MTTTAPECKVEIYPEVLNDSNKNDLVGAIDQGTSSTRFMIFTKTGDVLASAQMEHKQYFPSGEDKVGWHEHSPLEIWFNTKTCITSTLANLPQPPPLLASIGITNQRETTIAWNARTGLPYHNAIVWDDTRTTQLARDLAQGDPNRLRETTGLPIASYFAGTKVKWLVENVEELKRDLFSKERPYVRFGTVDTWLLYQLTGTNWVEGGITTDGLFLTDATNASRWLFMDITTGRWDQSLIDDICGAGVIPMSALPTIKSSSEVYGLCAEWCGCDIVGVPISGILGDQQAALFGQAGFRPGDAKCTYGTGAFLMMNTGDRLVPSKNGLLTTVASQIGKKTTYALEGSISHSGSVVQWLRDQLQIISEAGESETLAAELSSNDGLYFVPAFAGLFAPYWRSDARGCLVGMTATHDKRHLCRSALEASAYQTRDVFDAIVEDCGVTLKNLKVDGGGTVNELLMQFQADMIDVEVVRPKCMETTAIGAAFAAGLAVGVWGSLDEIKSLWAEDKVWKPTMTAEDRDKNWKGWKKAVTKSFGWVDED